MHRFANRFEKINNFLNNEEIPEEPALEVQADQKPALSGNQVRRRPVSNPFLEQQMSQPASRGSWRDRLQREESRRQNNPDRYRVRRSGSDRENETGPDPLDTLSDDDLSNFEQALSDLFR